MLPALQQMLNSLIVPAAFARYDKLADTSVLNSLLTWKSNTEPILHQLSALDASTLSNSELAELVRIFAPLTAVAQWSSSGTRSLASVRLASIPASEKLVAHVLSEIVKPIFASAPHPRLHTSTARILPRPADVQDTYIEQLWKEHPGLDEVMRWCLLNTESSAYEKAWPLFLPPIMSFLDDYQVPYKLLGIRLVSDMLTRVPPDLLLRTGVDALLFNSLINSLSHLGDGTTPDFICSAVLTCIKLIDLTTPASPDDVLLYGNESQNLPVRTRSYTIPPLQSASICVRFSRLSTLLSSSLLGTVIMYTPTFPHPFASSIPDPDTLVEHDDTGSVHIPETPLWASMPQKQSFSPTLIAAAQSLPPVLSALGIGGTRFLKGIIHVLAEWLSLPLPVIFLEPQSAGDDGLCTVDIALHLASLSSLCVLFHTCHLRMAGWSTTIIDALGRCWVGCLDIEHHSQGNISAKDEMQNLKQQLKDVAIQLAKVCPDVVKKEYAILMMSNKTLFQDLVGDICSSFHP